MANKSLLEKVLSMFGAGSIDDLSKAEKDKRARAAQERLRKRNAGISNKIGGTGNG